MSKNPEVRIGQQTWLSAFYNVMKYKIFLKICTKRPCSVEMFLYEKFHIYMPYPA